MVEHLMCSFCEDIFEGSGDKDKSLVFNFLLISKCLQLLVRKYPVFLPFITRVRLPKNIKKTNESEKIFVR